MGRWFDFRSWTRKYLQTKTGQEYLLAIKLIAVHCPIVFLAAFFFLNLLSGSVVGSWWVTTLNILGAGSLYYLFIDIYDFIVKTTKGRE